MHLIKSRSISVTTDKLASLHVYSVSQDIIIDNFARLSPGKQQHLSSPLFPQLLAVLSNLLCRQFYTSPSYPRRLNGAFFTNKLKIIRRRLSSGTAERHANTAKGKIKGSNPARKTGRPRKNTINGRKVMGFSTVLGHWFILAIYLVRLLFPTQTSLN